MENIILDTPTEDALQRRRDLLPKWIKVFTWIFLIFGAFVPVSLFMAIMGHEFNVALYGLETSDTFSLIGISVLLIFALKGIVAFGLWTEKTWAVNLAVVDAIIGIIVCVLVMFAIPFIGVEDGGVVSFQFRLELIALIPYLLKMSKIKSDWISRN